MDTIKWLKKNGNKYSTWWCSEDPNFWYSNIEILQDSKPVWIKSKGKAKLESISNLTKELSKVIGKEYVR